MCLVESVPSTIPIPMLHGRTFIHKNGKMMLSDCLSYIISSVHPRQTTQAGFSLLGPSNSLILSLMLQIMSCSRVLLFKPINYLELSLSVKSTKQASSKTLMGRGCNDTPDMQMFLNSYPRLTFTHLKTNRIFLQHSSPSATIKGLYFDFDLARHSSFQGLSVQHIRSRRCM